MRRQRFDQINIVPFVDIVLVLLVIVLATATFLRQNSVQVDLPEHIANGKDKTSVSSNITIDINGNYYLDKRPLEWKNLKKAINNFDANSSLLILYTDKKAPFESFSKLILFLKNHGFKHISIATQNPK